MEWFRPAIVDLIDAYKENENLYNPKHALYYNKQARKKSLEAILVSVQKSRPNTSTPDIYKKIQSLRTQFGQEVQKIEKSKSLNDSNLLYVPRIWWFARFEFIGSYMKMRSDPTTPLSIKMEQNSFANKDSETYFEVVSERTVDNNEEFEDDQELTSELEMHEDEESTPSAAKKRRLAYPVSIKEHKDNIQTIEYIINEEPAEISPPEPQYTRSHQAKQSPISTATLECKKRKRRSKAFGKYVGTLMREIKDDKVFYETQNEILKLVEKAAAQK